jgi:hypothetical protein
MPFGYNMNGSMQYIITLTFIFVIGYVGNLYRETFASQSSDEYDLIRKYLLNDSPLYGYNKPKLWIHTKYEYNTREWESFGSRSSTDLNQPFIHLCIKSIIGNCSEDFNIVLIDDQAFSKIIPGWDIGDISTLAEPIRTRVREVGLATLLYIYGGVVVPNTFVCTQPLITLYKNGTNNNMFFITENINNTCSKTRDGRTSVFVPDTFFMGSKKDNSTVRDYIDHVKLNGFNPHSSGDFEFKTNLVYWFDEKKKQQIVNVINGELVGVKDGKKRPILIEDLFEEEYLNINRNTYGIYIPGEEISLRHKYNWFTTMSESEILSQNAFICKFMASAIVDVSEEYPEKHSSGKIVSNVVSI